MHPLTFIESLEDDYDAKVIAVTRNATGALETHLEYDSFLLPTGTIQSATLRCFGTTEWNVSTSFINSITYSHAHPLLFNHNSPQAQLFFSSAPASPSDVFFIAHKVLNTELSGWRNPCEYLHGRPEEIYAHLSGGYGLLARGPHSLSTP